MTTWARSDYLQLAGIVVSGIMAIGIYILQKRLTDKQRVDHRLEIEEKAGDKLHGIRHNDRSSKVQLYNVKLLNKKYFTQNRRDFLWGYPFHAAELYGANFDGLEFIVGIQEWDGRKYYQAGVIPYERILGIRPEGDSTFSGMIMYVKPKLLQRDKYSIAYKSYRYYPLGHMGDYVKKPRRHVIADSLKGILQKLRYRFYSYWRQKLRDNTQ